LTADSFRAEQKYSLERRWLLNRAIHGWGVVYGYPVKAGAVENQTARNQLNIGPGLALDICGRELLQTNHAVIVDELIVVDANNERVDLKDALSSHHYHGMCWLLSVHYAEALINHVTIEDSCRCEHDEWDHTCETVRYTLRPVDCDECCKDFPCELHCNCGFGRCCEEPPDYTDNPDYGESQNYRANRSYPEGQTYTEQPAYGEEQDLTYNPEQTNNHDHERCKANQRGGCRCLCDHLINLPQPECKPLCEIEESCGRVWVDLDNGVPIACVLPTFDDCDRVTFKKVEECGPRRLVKRNDLLFDLIRGCDLTRIIEIGWSDWHTSKHPIKFDDFKNAFGDIGKRDPKYLTDKFWVEFSRPVREDTVRPDCFAITVLTTERGEGWWQVLRVPIVDVDTSAFPPEPSDPPNHVRGATIVVDGAWADDAIGGTCNIFKGDDTHVEVEVRGDRMVDCLGQQLDLNSIGRCPSPTGNNTPGGTFLSTFVVEPVPEPSRRVKYQTGDTREGVSS
jgi:hypothetical protein